MMSKKVILLVVFTFHGLSGSIFWELRDEAHQTQALVADLRLQQDALLWTSAQQALLDFPHFLERANKELIPLFIVVPPELKKAGPLDDCAKTIEPIRTALSWTRAYYEVCQGIIAPLIIEDASNRVLDAQAFVSLLNQQSIACRCIPSQERSLRRQFLSCPFSAPTDNLHDLAYWSPEKVHDRRLLDPSISFDTNAREKKTILITGGCGFIGSALCEKLLQKGYCVIAVDNLSSGTRSRCALLEADPYFCCIEHDVAQPFTLDWPLYGIIHAASLPSPAYYYEMPYQTLTAGLHGCKNTLELACKHHARYLFTSTSEVYGDPEIHPQIEEYAGNVDYLGKRSAYDQSKRGAETLINLYFEKYTIDVRIARIFNTYGPGMNLYDGRVIPKFIGQVLQDQPITIYGSGLQTRSFCYIDDLVDGLVALLESETLAGQEDILQRVFNLGMPDEFTINELAQKMEQLCNRYGKKLTSNHVENPDLSDPRIRKPDIRRAQQILNFNPTISLEEGLEKTFLYYFKQHNGGIE